MRKTCVVASILVILLVKSCAGLGNGSFNEEQAYFSADSYIEGESASETRDRTFEHNDNELFTFYLIQRDDDRIVEYRSVEEILDEYGLEYSLAYEYSAPVKENSILDIDNRYIKYTAFRLLYDETKQKGLCIKQVSQDSAECVIINDFEKDNWAEYEYYSTEPAGNNRSILAQRIEGYQEEIIYDNKDRIIHFSANEHGVDAGEGDRKIYEIDYKYDDKGILKYRCYRHFDNTWFDSEKTIWESYFDNEGRIVLDSYYLSHGWYYIYYYYETDGRCPLYAIHLDSSLGLISVDRFVKYKNELNS